MNAPELDNSQPDDSDVPLPNPEPKIHPPETPNVPEEELKIPQLDNSSDPLSS